MLRAGVAANCTALVLVLMLACVHVHDYIMYLIYVVCLYMYNVSLHSSIGGFL